MDQVRELEPHLLEVTERFEVFTDVVRQTIDDIKTPGLYTFEEPHQTILYEELDRVEQRTITAYNQIKNIRHEVEFQVSFPLLYFQSLIS